jgi:signal recognition particle receptor subunit beta
VALVHLDDRQIHLKIVYYGPGLSGKTTNLQYLFGRIPEKLRGQWVALKTEEERTLYFDFLPFDIGVGDGLRAKFHLYTVPGQARFRRTRLLLLEDVDGSVFVADSSWNRLKDNRESLSDLQENLRALGRDLTDVPVIYQLNKRDIETRLPSFVLRDALGVNSHPCVEATANRGIGVVGTLKTATKLVLHNLKVRC